MHSLRSYFLISLVSLPAIFAAAITSIDQPISLTPQLNITSQIENDNVINPQRAADIADIRQAINLYSIALDQRNLDLLSRVFTNDVTVNFNLPSGEILHGLLAVMQALATLLTVPSQHDESTFYYVSAGSHTAQTTTYNTATFFGTGEQMGQALTSYGR